MIIGITGTLGAGKGTIVEFLKKRGFVHYSVRDFLIEEIKKRGLPIDRNSMVSVANQLRTLNSPSYIVEQLYKKAEQGNNNVVIESIRTPGEAELIKNKGGYLLAVDAEPQRRYSRIILRQSETDNQSFDEFLEHEKREMFSINPYEQNLSRCIQMADFVLENNKDFENLKKQVDEILIKILEREQKNNFERPEKLSEEIQKYKRPSWDEYFMKITSVVAERSTCLRHNVGAVIVKNKRIITTGYNGSVRGQKDCLELGCKKDELKLETGFGAEECRAVHAEQNAIAQAGLHGANIDGGTIYCTHIPCRMCAKQIINAGLKELVYYFDYAGSKNSLDLLQECGINIKKISRPENKINFKD